MLRAALALVASILLLGAGVPAQALVPATATESAAVDDAAGPQIDNIVDNGADGRIEGRIRGIFAELPAFAGVDVAVEQGVVKLSGLVPAEKDIARAEAIAGRVSGVVTIENRLERDLSVDSSLATLGGLQDKLDGLVRALPLIALALAVALAIIALGYLLARLVSKASRFARNPFLADLIASLIRFAFIIGGVVVALDMIGATALLGAVLGGAGIIGIALGFAMRETVENHVASLLLSLRQPFRANDHVLIGDLEGRVIRLTTRATVLMTLDGNHLRIPNGQVFKAVITNYTRNPQRRFDFVLGVDADENLQDAMAQGIELLKALPFVLNQPEPGARIVEVGDSAIAIRYLAWIDQTEADWFKSKSQAIIAVKEGLEAAGFGLPEPIYRLRIDPRTSPLPLSGVEDARPRSGDAPDPAPPPKTPAGSIEAPRSPADVKPESEIAEMVERERRAGGSEDKDLLDDGCPVE